ncbi:Hypothetical protein ACGLYG10_1966 [Actinomyces glycerinitolerans]|uniref:Uncharacterized protein n=1 Tax=Actinomyces glycerinitolerans TaxID=1892869 RepID=A0A1M4S0H6_9ACTO|nr:Hypothetical protein ACGLYG10_1966 [Actinomyces glycerinitolerans]
MEPGLGDREDENPNTLGFITYPASMEPGLGDREDVSLRPDLQEDPSPQWSPALETGKTR